MVAFTCRWAAVSLVLLHNNRCKSLLWPLPLVQSEGEAGTPGTGRVTMEKRGTDKIDDLGIAETPEDVAVLYSWANLHGAKYRDFTASRREYRAQLRHRAAEQVREQALLAQAEAEAAAEAAEAT